MNWVQLSSTIWLNQRKVKHLEDGSQHVDKNSSPGNFILFVTPMIEYYNSFHAQLNVKIHGLQLSTFLHETLTTTGRE
ncbi:hypothetical protein Y1Q_0013253 [Alligator mississippiensis]|uniref:Uncharacterized protein n=1 Tax=Alligator mississippiensis TaxID=8496 RepID=A0A151NUU8_ALLMI|nr:hypothetical protein Y1Q_0013253 [Alligator mississippiensis]